MNPSPSKPTKRETFDINALENLLRHDGISNDDKRALRLYKKARENGNEVSVIYEFGKKLTSGRIYPQKGRGLQSFPSAIRACLAQKYYWDIDMVNSQPVIMVAKCKQFGWPCPMLEEYVLNRADKLAELMAELGCDRAGAKQICLSILFGATAYKNIPPYFLDLMTELSMISILAKDKFPIIAEAVKSMPRPNASCLAHWIQGEEATIMEFIDAFLKTKGRTLDVNIHDGGLVRKWDGETVFPVSILRDIEQAVVSQFGIAISMEVKHLTHTFTFEDNGEVPVGVVINDLYATRRFVELCGDDLRKHAGEIHILKDDGRWSVSPDDIKSRVFNYPQMCFYQVGATSPRDYHGNNRNVSALLANLSTQVKNGIVPFQFDYEFVSTTGNNSEKIIQCFSELLNINSNNNLDVRNYMVNWLAHSIQKPAELPGVAMIFSGAKGCGKDTLFDFLGEFVYGSRYYSNYDRTIKLFEKHDTQRMGKIFVKVEEADRRICLENANALKSMLTSNTLVFEPKNKGEITIDNHVRMVMTVNQAIPVDLSQGERRFMITNCSTMYVGKFDFWNDIRAMLFNPEAGRVIGEWLMAQDISNFQAKKFPICAYQEEVKEEVKCSENLFVEQWDGEPLTATEFFSKYTEFCNENNLTRCFNMTSLGLKLIVLVRDGLLIKKRSTKTIVYSKAGM